MRGFVRNYEVNAIGQPVSTVREGGWVRGQLVRVNQPQFRSTVWDLKMYDPANPAMWNNPPFI